MHHLLIMSYTSEKKKQNKQTEFHKGLETNHLQGNVLVSLRIAKYLVY